MKRYFIRKAVRISIRGLVGLLFVLLLASCSSDDDSHTDGDPVAVRFGSGNIALSRITTDGKWIQGDKTGIFMIANGATGINGNIREGADNIKYKADAGDANQSSFTPVDANQTIYYPQDGGKVDFIAYCPYKTPLTDYKLPVDVSLQTAPGNIDVLYGKSTDTGSGYDKNSGTVDLPFRHVLSKLGFTLTAGVGLTGADLAGATIAISGIATTGAMDLDNGTVTSTNSNQTITVNTAANGESSSAIVLPQTSFSGVKLTVTLSGNNTYEWDFSQGSVSSWQAGRSYGYTITVSKTGIAVTIGDITDWMGTDALPTEGVGRISYKVGDYYPDPQVDLNNALEKARIKGVVFWVDPNDNCHGKVISLDESAGKRWADDSNKAVLTGVNDMDNGWVNMRKMTTFINENSKSWDNFPAFEWVHTTKNGGTANYGGISSAGVWYLPAKNEMKVLYAAFCGKIYGGTLTWGDHSTMPGDNTEEIYTSRLAFNKKLTDAGGIGLPIGDGVRHYWSSSEYNGNYPNINSQRAWDFSILSGYTYDERKTINRSVRAVLAF